MMNILILGDVGASDSNCQAFCNAEEDLFASEIRKMCSEADIVLFNLEKPLTDEINPLGKCPPDYSAPTKTINGINMLHPTAVTLANNHILDQKEKGLQSTIETLRQNGIQYAGAGSNIREARQGIVIEKKGCRIGVYACCEKEFSYATETSAGTNVFDPMESFDDIQEMRQKCNYLIVLHHGGLQNYPYPTPLLQKVCRRMCEKGADLVVCQHSHIIGCEESHAGSRIVYGQGNFLLDDLPADSWRCGLMLNVMLDKHSSNMEIIPTEVKDHKVIMHHDSDSIKRAYYERSQSITNARFVSDNYQAFCEKKLPDYLMKLSGTRQTARKILQKTKMEKLLLQKYKEDNYYYILDYLYCDAHREAIASGIEALIDRKKH